MDTHSIASDLLQLWNLSTWVGFPPAVLVAAYLRGRLKRELQYSLSFGFAHQYFAAFIKPVGTKLNGTDGPDFGAVRIDKILVILPKSSSDVSDARLVRIPADLARCGYDSQQVKVDTTRGVKNLWVRSRGQEVPLAFDIPQIASGIGDAVHDRFGEGAADTRKAKKIEAREYSLFNKQLSQLVRRANLEQHVILTSRDICDITPETVADEPERLSWWRARWDWFTGQ